MSTPRGADSYAMVSPNSGVLGLPTDRNELVARATVWKVSKASC